MGGVASFKPFTRFFFLIILIFIGPWIFAEAKDTRETPPSNLDGGEGVGDIATGKSPPSLSPLSPSPGKSSALKPSVVIVVAVLTTMFSLTFLILLYFKHCKSGNVSSRNSHGGPVSVGRNNSGIDRTVIESLPIFRFGSLRGQKDGLECAVCLTRFESSEVLRLLPKCKHAFHVECVDTWLDAHSTCPLCRYRVDPEDILLVEEAKILSQNQPIPPSQNSDNPEQHLDIESGRHGTEPDLQNGLESNSNLRRVSGRHSSVGEKGGGGFLQIILQHRGNVEGETTQQNKTTPFRRSLDSATSMSKKRKEGVSVSEGPRKDGLLLMENKHRLEHRIIVSPSQKPNVPHQRWSDVQASDLLYLTSEMIISEDSHRLSSCSGPSLSRRQQQNMQLQLPLYWKRGRTRSTVEEDSSIDGNRWGGRGVINSRSVSEITGLSRCHRGGEEVRRAGVVSRWLAWMSQSQEAVR